MESALVFLWRMFNGEPGPLHLKMLYHLGSGRRIFGPLIPVPQYSAEGAGGGARALNEA